MKLPRWARHLRAILGGWFWGPCPICGEYFGGFETGDLSLMADWNHGECVCSRRGCQDATRRRNDDYMDSHPAPAKQIHVRELW